MKTGDRVVLTCEGRTVTAEVVLASENGRSLMLSFDAMLDGHVGMMPVLLDEAGVYRAVMTGNAVTIEPLPTWKGMTLNKH